MQCVNEARDRARQVEERLAREERALEEREEAYGKVLIQLGQDTAISQEHSRLVARQRERVADLRKVQYFHLHSCATSVHLLIYVNVDVNFKRV